MPGKDKNKLGFEREKDEPVAMGCVSLPADLKGGGSLGASGCALSSVANSNEQVSLSDGQRIRWLLV